MEDLLAELQQLLVGIAIMQVVPLRLWLFTGYR